MPGVLIDKPGRTIEHAELYSRARTGPFCEGGTAAEETEVAEVDGPEGVVDRRAGAAESAGIDEGTEATDGYVDGRVGAVAGAGKIEGTETGGGGALTGAYRTCQGFGTAHIE